VIRREFDPDGLDPAVRATWDALVERAAVAVRTLPEDRAAGKALDESIWKGFRDFFAEHVFHHRCGYCVGDGTQHYDHSDHWRPKGAVTSLEAPRRAVLDDQGNPHPGYWWLVYDWRNIVPACARCNSAAKGSVFPIAASGTYVFEAIDGDVDLTQLDAKEQPLLLHPLRDHPEDHLTYTRYGKIREKAGSARGKATIDICRLDRGELVKERRKVAKKIKVRDMVTMLIIRALHEHVPVESLIDEDAIGETYEGFFREMLRQGHEEASPLITYREQPAGHV
jgi:hypothetical protein